MDGALAESVRDALGQMADLGVAVLQFVGIFIGAAFIHRALRRPVRRWLAAALLPENAKTLLANVITFAVYVGAATVVLTLWGVSWSALFTAIGVSTLIVALGLQSALQSLAGGIFILLERPFNVGDEIMVTGPDVEGVVEEIGLRTTVIRSEEGRRIVVPNSLVFTQAVINSSPDRTVLTIVTVRGLGGRDVTNEQTRARVAAALDGVPGFTALPEVMVRSRLAKLTVPRGFARIPWLGAPAERLMHRTVQFTTWVRVIWTGSGGRATREEVVQRLEALYPEAMIRVRRL